MLISDWSSDVCSSDLVVSNPSGERSAGLNAAIRAAQSPIIVRVDARSSIRPRHLAEYETILRGDPSVGVTGGRQVPVSESSQVVPRAIARPTGNPRYEASRDGIECVSPWRYGW